ncbi:MAG: alpha/beta hydrolase [Clostridia bacterium]|nr:alpha/beta hydrolase [Clostridia bacterium]
MTTYPLWEGKAPGAETEIPSIDCYIPAHRTSDAAFVILPGGAYAGRAPHEGVGFAEFLNGFGIAAFVVAYRVFPAHFPDPLLDARRACRFIRANAEKFGIDEGKVAVIGSSAGGHLAALLSTYRAPIDGEGVDEIDAISPFPDLQVLCYPVISSDEEVSHAYSYQKLLGDRYDERDAYSPELLVGKETPPAFIWHTAEDAAVNVENSYRYATALRRAGIPCEMHIFPFGRHGLGRSQGDAHVAQWVELLRAYLILHGYLPKE